jgi:hypothetical protein
LLTQKTTISDVKNLAHIFSWGWVDFNIRTFDFLLQVFHLPQAVHCDGPHLDTGGSGLFCRLWRLPGQENSNHGNRDSFEHRFAFLQHSKIVRDNSKVMLHVN